MSPNRRSQKSQNQKDKSQSDTTDNNLGTIESIFTNENPSTKDIMVILREIFNSQQFIATKYDELIKRNLELENTCNKLSSENKALKKEVSDIKIEIKRIENTCNEKKIEIHGVPQQEKEDLSDIVRKIAENFREEINKEDIEDIYRIQSKLKRNNPIIVSFVKKRDKEKFLLMRRKKSLFTNEINMGETRSQIFINEYLSRKMKEILWKSKRLKAEKKFQFMWIRNGTIFLRKTENSEIIKITDQEDLEKLQ